MKKFTTYITIFVLSFLFINTTWAQSKSNRAKMEDPYNKPAVWEKIKLDPKSKVLWEDYVGKKASNWSADEKNFIMRRRDELWRDVEIARKAAAIRQKADKLANGTATDFSVKASKNEEVTASTGNNRSNLGSPSSSKRFGSPSSSPSSSVRTMSEKIALDEAGKKQMDNAINLILMESAELKEMKKNISANFLIIQDIYADTFKNMGLKYIYYEKIYPNGGYPEEKWVAEMDKKIEDVKRKQVREITEKYSVAAKGNM